MSPELSLTVQCLGQIAANFLAPIACAFIAGFLFAMFRTPRP